MDATTLSMIQRAGFLLLLFLAVSTAIYLAFGWAERRQVARQRLERGAKPAVVAVDGQDSIVSLKRQDKRSNWLSLIQAIEARGVPLSDPKDTTIRNRLIAAGYDSPSAPAVYAFIRLALVILFPITTFVLIWLSGATPSIFKIYFIEAISAVIGLYAPGLFVRLRSSRLQQQILNGFPDALDLLLVCVEAGLGLEAAFNRVGMEMQRSHPLLARQFGAVVFELRAGRSHENALRRMADRAGSEDIRGFATLLVQSTRLGSSIAQTLRTYSSEMRERRRLRAEEKAHRLPVLLSLPLVAFMLPTMIGVLMLPAFIRVIRIMLPAMAGTPQ